MRRQGRFSARRRCARRCAGYSGRRSTLRQPLGHRADRILNASSATFTAQGFGRRRLHIGGRETDAERFGARRVAHEAHDREQLGRLRCARRHPTDAARLDEAAALASVVPDPQIVEALAAYLDNLALPEQRLLLRCIVRAGTQRRLVAHDDSKLGLRRIARRRRLCRSGDRHREGDAGDGDRESE